MAVAHQMLTIICHMLRNNQPYREFGSACYDEQHKPEITRRLVERLQKLGYQVTLEATITPEEVQEINSDVEGRADENQTATTARRRRGRPCKCAERGLVCPHGTLAETPTSAAPGAAEINSQQITTTAPPGNLSH